MRIGNILIFFQLCPEIKILIYFSRFCWKLVFYKSYLWWLFYSKAQRIFFFFSPAIIINLMSPWQVSSPSIYQGHWKQEERAWSPLCNSLCCENHGVHHCCWPVSANPGNGTSLVLQEGYQSFQAHNKPFPILPARWICYCNPCRHPWIWHLVVCLVFFCLQCIHWVL